jgi:N-acetylmuramoyl-L-alanine amidase
MADVADDAVLAQPAGSGDRIIAQGEGMARLAIESGHFWQTLWELPENKELREARGHPEVLLPGDRVTIPPLRPKSASGATGKVHRFRRRGMPVPLTHVVRDAEGKPVGGLRYELVAGGATFAETTGDDGVISHWVDPMAGEATLTVWPARDGFPETLVWKIAVGHLDPVNTVSGMISRLNSLGYSAGDAGDVLTAAARQALTAFQRKEGVEVTGTIDGATISAMLAKFGR